MTTASRTLRGIGVSPGVAYAPALVVDTRFPDVPDRSIARDEVEGEIARLHAAAGTVAAELEQLRDRVRQRAGHAESGIFDAQILMARDEEFLRSVEDLIRRNALSAETAFEFKALEIRVAWSGTGNLRLRERLADLSAVQTRILRLLMGHGGVMDEVTIEGPVVVVAHELSPGLTVQLDREHLVGLVSVEGTRTSHAAILAHSLGIPAVMGVAGAMDQIVPGMVVLVDGREGLVVIAPTRGELESARRTATRRQKLELQFEGVLQEPARTPDGCEVALRSNVDLPEEIDLAVRHGAQGVGLLRTEFLLTGKAHLPGEEEQAAYFRRVAAAFAPHPVTVRTYDLGGDKFPVAFDAPVEANPALGWRSIRVCLDHEEIFRPQLRALLRAARPAAGASGAGRNLRVKLPLVTRVDEVERTREILEEEADNLAREGIPAASEIPVGVMVETPAAALLSDHFARVSDFMSVGTNDLTQYTLGVDRGNARLAPRFTPHDPAVVRQLATVLAAGRTAGIPVSVCGEMASEPLTVVLLLGLGYTDLSVAPPALLMVKWLLRSIPFAAAEEAARVALAAPTAALVARVLTEVVGDHIDLALLGLHPVAPRSSPR